MKNEMIKNATFNTMDDIRNLCNELCKDTTFDAVPETLANKVSAFNEGVVSATAKQYLCENSVDFFKSIVCVKTETPFDAITATVAKITLTDSGNLQVDEVNKALIFDDFYRAKLSTLASHHADGKATKEDRSATHKYFYGNNGEGLMQCLIYTATNAQKLDGQNLKKSADLIKAYATIKDEYAKTNKENPFDGDSNRKKVEQITRVLVEFIGDFTEWALTKYHFDAFAQIVATTNRKGVFTINNTAYAMQTLVLVARHAFNKIPFEVKDKANILHKNK